MQKFKIELFKEENSGDLPYQEVKESDLNSFVSYLKESTHYSGADSSVDFYDYILSILNSDIDFNDIDDPLLFSKITDLLGINNGEEECFIVWRYPNQIDKFSISTLKEFWDYIWYPTGDDSIIMVIPSKRVLLLLTHYGDIKYKII